MVKKSSSIQHDFLVGGGELGKRIRALDWDATPLGAVGTWPQSLRTAVSIILNSSFPMFIWWGKDELTNIYNDAYVEILGKKHPKALGRSAQEAWAEIWDDVGPLAEQVLSTGKPVYMKDLRLIMNRHGYDEETYFTFSYSPIRNEEGEIAGLFCAVTETTVEVLAQQKLQESEERFRNLADTAPTFIAMADVSGNAVYFNKPWLEYTGKKLKEMLGLGWLSVLHPEDAPKFERDFKAAFSRRVPINKEYRFRRADGEYRWMLAIGAPRFTPDGHFSGYFGTYTDFHEVKQAQIAVEESELRFRTLIENSTNAVQMVSPEGKILFSSDAVFNVIGYTPEELADTGVSPFLHPEDQEYFFDQFTDLIKHPGKTIKLQYRVKHKDGSWAWLETVGVNHLQTPNINALVGNFRNITIQKEAEDRLRSSEERFRALAENIPNLAWMADEHGQIYWYNSRWYEYTGTTLRQMEGLGWQPVHDPDYYRKVVSRWKRSLKAGKPFEMVFPIKRADGTFRPFLTRIVPVISEGKIRQWVGTSTDISEQMKVRRAEARNVELEKITEQMAKQKKELIALNNAKDEFIGMASHQLRTPATAVKQYVSLLLDGMTGPLTPDQIKYLQVAYDSNERELDIITDLLRTAQMDSSEYALSKDLHDIVRLVGEAASELKPTLEMRRQKLIMVQPDKPVRLSVDATEMKLVIVNLLENASKYSFKDTTIKVSIVLKEECMELLVADQGVGISKDDQERIFDKFTRVDNKLSDTVSGTGLGLYWVKQLIEMHKGSVRLKSALGKGSTFIVRLPL